MKTTRRLIPMVQFILEIDWMSTKDFCDKYGVPHPRLTSNIQASADQFLQVDAVKHKLFIEHAKLLNKKITADIIVKNMGFKSEDVRGGQPRYTNGNYTIINDQYGFWFDAYCSVDGFRIDRLEDISHLGLEYQNG